MIAQIPNYFARFKRCRRIIIGDAPDERDDLVVGKRKLSTANLIARYVGAESPVLGSLSQERRSMHSAHLVLDMREPHVGSSRT